MGQKILAAVASIDRQTRRFTMTLRELLGTWMENASRFRPGETVRGIVRSVKEYGTFIELAPTSRSGRRQENPPAWRQGFRVHQKHSPGPDEDQAPDHRKAARRSDPPPIRYQISRRRTGPLVYSPPPVKSPPLRLCSGKAANKPLCRPAVGKHGGSEIAALDLLPVGTGSLLRLVVAPFIIVDALAAHPGRYCCLTQRCMRKVMGVEIALLPLLPAGVRVDVLEMPGDLPGLSLSSDPPWRQ